MIPFFKKLLWDETAWVRWARSAIAGAALTAPLLGWPEWVAPAGTMLALLLGAGDKNPTTGGTAPPAEGP